MHQADAHQQSIHPGEKFQLRLSTVATRSIEVKREMCVISRAPRLACAMPDGREERFDQVGGADT